MESGFQNPRNFCLWVQVIAWFVVTFGTNTTSDISKLLNLRQFWNITSGIYAKYHVQIMLLFVYTTTSKRFVIFTCRYFKLSWKTTALSQSNCRNFSCSSIKSGIAAQGIRNPSEDWNPESKFHWQWLEPICWESGIHGVKSRIQNPESKAVLLDDKNTNNLHFSNGVSPYFWSKTLKFLQSFF